MEIELTLEVVKAIKTLLRFAEDNGFHAGVRIDQLGGLGLLGNRKREYFSPTGPGHGNVAITIGE